MKPINGPEAFKDTVKFNINKKPPHEVFKDSR